MVACVVGVTALAAALGLSILLLGLQRVFASAPTLWHHNDQDISKEEDSAMEPLPDA